MNTFGDKDSVSYRTSDHTIYVTHNLTVEKMAEKVGGETHTRIKDHLEEGEGEVENENHSAQRRSPDHIMHVTHNVTPEKKKAKIASRKVFIDNNKDEEEGKVEIGEVAYYDSETESIKKSIMDTANVDMEIISGQYKTLLSAEMLKGSLGIVYIESEPGQEAFACHLYLNIIQKEQF
jgi:hypothetical protein